MLLGACDATRWAAVAKPPFVLVAARGDPLFDASYEFARMYRSAGGAADVVETTSSHCTAFLFDFPAWDRSIDLWYNRLVGAAPPPRPRADRGVEADL